MVGIIVTIFKTGRLTRIGITGGAAFVRVVVASAKNTALLVAAVAVVFIPAVAPVGIAAAVILRLAAALPKNTFAAKQAPKVAKALGLVIFVRGLFCALPAAVVAALRIPWLGLRLAISIRTGAFAGCGTARHNGSRRQRIIAAAVPAALRGLGIAGFARLGLALLLVIGLCFGKICFRRF